jgi:carbamoyl-phosphate synthase large subunit
MAGEKIANMHLPKSNRIDHVAVKEAVLPFSRFPGVDTILGPEMRSTGEVMGLDSSFDRAFLKSQIAASTHLPTEGSVFVSVKNSDKDSVVDSIRKLKDLGFKVIATRGTATHLQENGIDVEAVNKVYEGRPHIVDKMKSGEISLVFNTTEGMQSFKDSYDIRATALDMKIPYYTTAAGARASVRAIKILCEGTLDVAPLQAYRMITTP